MPPVRIVAVLQTPRDAQSSVLLGYLALGAELSHAGHSLAILAPDDFPLARRFGGRWTPFVYPLAVAGWTRRNAREFDVVVSHSYACWLAASTGALRGTPLVVAFHGFEPLYHRALCEAARRAGRPLSWRYRLLQEQLMPRWLRSVCRRASLVLCLNGAERDDIQSRGWTTADRLAVFGHGVNDSYFAPPRSPRPLGRLLFVGQWLPMKGTAYLRDAASTLLRRHPALSLECVGTLADASIVLGDFPADLRSRVMVRPRVDQTLLPQIYADADAFIFPSLYDGFGRALLEAMAARLPIVTTAVGIAQHALRDGESCLIVPAHDAAAIVAAVERLNASPALRADLGAAAHAVARTYRERDRTRELADMLLAVAATRG